MDTGYDPRFLGPDTGTPEVADTGQRGTTNPPRLDYCHFSLELNTDRRLAWWCAWNIDGLRLVPGVGRDDQRFVPDRRVALDAQTTERVYAANRLDRGHIARRADLLWGTLAEAQQANSDSFYFTNITPQMDDFNQSSKGGVWGSLENAVITFDGLAPQRRVSVFGGPVLRPDDPPYRGLVRIPVEHWKVIVYLVGTELRTRAFLLSQTIDLEVATPDDVFEPFATYEVDLPTLQNRTGLRFPTLATAVPEATFGPALVEHVTDITW